MNIKKLLTVIALFALLSGCETKVPAAFTINGAAVEKEELVFYMKDYSALVAADLEEKHGLDSFDENFWTNTYGEIIPIEYLKDYTVQKISRIKIEQLLAQENDIKAELSFAKLQEDNEKQNSQREQDERNGEILYGPVQRDFVIYFQEIYLTMKQKLIEALIKNDELRINDEQIRAYYNENKAILSGSLEDNRQAIKQELINTAYEKLIDKRHKAAELEYIDMAVEADSIF